MTTESTTLEPWERLTELLDAGDAEAVEEYWRTLPSGELARTLSRMTETRQQQLLTLLDPDEAADLLDDLSFAQAADMLEELPAEQAAALVDELDSDDQVDMLSELDEQDAQAIIERMDPVEAADVRRLSQYEPDTAGGIMVTDYLAFGADQSVDQVLADLRGNAGKYAEYDVQYIYLVEAGDNALRGVVRIKDLVLAPHGTPIATLNRTDVESVPVTTSLDVLEEFFDRHDCHVAPVVDESSRLVGVVRRAHVQEALSARSEKTLMRFGGIIMGDELRTMPIWTRAARRMAFLGPTMGMSLAGAFVIMAYEPLIGKNPGLAIFLPMVAGLSGAAGNQAVAVSMRELTLGLAKPADALRVWGKELACGVLTGIAMSLLLFTVSWLLRGDHGISLTVASAMPLTILLAVTIGGCIPLLMTRLGLDPAMASSPITTTITDFCSFFIVLTLAAAAFHVASLN
ncbi:MAG: magnesium transporter [Phycisphaeraceae bacterium]|nr:magnesium transporter [Phycisphaeraceae bacterium]